MKYKLIIKYTNKESKEFTATSLYDFKNVLNTEIKNKILQFEFVFNNINQTDTKYFVGYKLSKREHLKSFGESIDFNKTFKNLDGKNLFIPFDNYIIIDPKFRQLYPENKKIRCTYDIIDKEVEDNIIKETQKIYQEAKDARESADLQIQQKRIKIK